VYLTWAIAVFLAFFPFSRINNFWRLNVVAGSIPTRASIKSPIFTRVLRVRLKCAYEVRGLIFMLVQLW
jgi:hypothetical protein